MILGSSNEPNSQTIRRVNKTLYGGLVAKLDVLR